MKQIKVYQTHVEISPYAKGDWPELEKFYSVYVRNGRRAFYKPFCYEIVDGVLFLPKGINILTLENKLGVNATYERKMARAVAMSKKYEIATPPKPPNEAYPEITQSDAIDFMSGSGKFPHTKNLSQLVLQLPTGFGKTYCCIAALVKLNLRAIVILHRSDLMSQWVEQILRHSTIPKDRIVEVMGGRMMEDVANGKIEGDIYLVLHQTLTSAHRTHGAEFIGNFFNRSGVGVKVVDETHEYLQSTIRTDFIANVGLNIYVSGTFSRSRYREKQIMQSAFSSAAVYGSASIKIPTPDRHVIYCPVMYKSALEEQYILGMRNIYGFSANKFIDFSINFDPRQSVISAICSILDKHCIEEPSKYPGRILIVSASKYSVKCLYNLLNERYAGIASVGMRTSDVDRDGQNEARKQHIICSTIKSSGVGFDEPIQTVICAEPHMSALLTKQLKGRLDRYIPGELTYFYDLIDQAIPYFDDVQKAHSKVMKDYAKDVVPIFL